MLLGRGNDPRVSLDSDVSEPKMIGFSKKVPPVGEEPQQEED